ncbi:MAG: branched-chain amino acid transport system II carrier protein [Actinomycetaceae bacterium]|nr:branched-chain amino acid transport system II carrier protein [Actinomycetaceae bacterium]
MTKNKTLSVMIIGGALFAMFFGAGNLVFPVQIGHDGGSHATAATIGFLITGVLLPVLAMVASATSENGINGIANRIGRVPGFIFALMAFLATGMGYAIPRVAAASYEMSFEPHLPNAGWSGLAIYSAIFFLIAAAMAINPGKMLDKIGTWLTPALLILLVVLITAAYLNMNVPAGTEIAEKYQANPTVTGLQDGYGTLDAIASFVFGIIIINALKQRGFKPGKELFRATALAGVVAGTLLALVYWGLSNIGMRIADKGIDNGGEGLAVAAQTLFGDTGQIIFGAIVVLACLTTGIGLIGASTEFFLTIFPRIPRNVMILIHVVISWAIASIGLTALLNFAIVIMMFCYPIVITMTLVCLIDIFVPGHMYWTYRGFVWTAALFGVFDAITTGIDKYGDLKSATGWTSFYDLIPLSGFGMGWIVPCLILGIAGIVADGVQKRLNTWKKYSDEPVGLIFQKGMTSTAKDRAKAAAQTRGESVDSFAGNSQ